MLSDAAAARQSLSNIPVFRAAQLSRAPTGASWRFDSIVGILSELSEETPSGALSFLADIIAEAQDQGEPVAWVAGTDSIFFPPDLAARGTDLSAIAVIRAGGEGHALTAAEWLLRSGAVGLVVVDCGGAWNIPDASLGRLLKLAEKGQSAVVFLTRKSRRGPSLGSRISLRACITRSGSGPFLVDVHTSKDKRANYGTHQTRHYNGPEGMHQR
jgi:recombination protein RecA